MYNHCCFIGNLTKDPELRYTPTGTAVASFNLAVNHKYKDTKETLFLPIVIFGKMAEVTAKYLSKGSQALIEGRLTERSWESDGQTKKKIELVASGVKFLNKKDGAASVTDENSAPPEEVTDLEPF